MQPIKFLSAWLMENTNREHYLFTTKDLRNLMPRLSDESFKMLLSRAVQSGILTKVCRSVYLYKKAMRNDGLLLFHVIPCLRPFDFNYISFETVLSDIGVISQIPLNWITIMTSGRTNKISCGEFGTIEFIHTNRSISDIIGHLSYDLRCGMWRASVKLALQDMKVTHRNCDLIDWDIANEFI
jgi:predicted transcriptional regulator of viral defense system